jgi:hypothetical protein
MEPWYALSTGKHLSRTTPMVIQPLPWGLTQYFTFGRRPAEADNADRRRESVTAASMNAESSREQVK